MSTRVSHDLFTCAHLLSSPGDWTHFEARAERVVQRICRQAHHSPHLKGAFPFMLKWLAFVLIQYQFNVETRCSSEHFTVESVHSRSFSFFFHPPLIASSSLPMPQAGDVLGPYVQEILAAVLHKLTAISTPTVIQVINRLGVYLKFNGVLLHSAYLPSGLHYYCFIHIAQQRSQMSLFLLFLLHLLELLLIPSAYRG